MTAPLAQLVAQLERAGHRVRGFDGRDDAFGTAQQAERVHRLGVGDGLVFGASGFLEPRVFGAHAGIIQTG